MADEYVVESIMGWRFNLRRRSREYLVKWENYSIAESTWEPEEHLNCPDRLNEFIDSLSEEELRCHNTTRIESLSGFQRHAPFLDCIGVDGPHESDDENSDKPDKQRFYCLVNFEDSDYVEEITVKEFINNEPRAAMKFFEDRLLEEWYRDLNHDDYYEYS